MIGFIADGRPGPSRPAAPQSGAAAQPRYDDSLSEHVAGGNIARVRAYFDVVFWEGRKERPDWTHLKIALLREDRPMLRLLGTWGAAPSDDDLASFRALAKEKYGDYLKLLRASGFRPGATPWEDISPSAAKTDAAAEAQFSELTAKAEAPRQLEKLPAEWRGLLQALQNLGADEAVIAGGALRDLFNQRPVKDVDIFLRSRGSQRKNRDFLTLGFATAGLAVEKQEFSSGYDRFSTAFPDPETTTRETGSGNTKRDRKAESWRIIAAPGKTEYNIIFIDDKLDRKLAETRPKSEQRSLFCGGLMEAFDIALCRIACDGREVVSTPEYRDDVKYQRVSLLLSNDSSPDHLQRVIKKYPDWQLNPAAQQALIPKPRPRQQGGYGYF